MQERFDFKKHVLTFASLSVTEKMNENLFGQHLVRSTVIRALRSHVRRTNPQKALVLSFHGWTGSGKNYVAKFIAESLFWEGMRSQYVHLFMSTLHFPYKEKVDEYRVSHVLKV